MGWARAQREEAGATRCDEHLHACSGFGSQGARCGEHTCLAARWYSFSEFQLYARALRKMRRMSDAKLSRPALYSPSASFLPIVL